jgi:Epoxide hydrolase N terminus
VSHEVLDDLRTRLALTRAPLDEGNADWSYGVPESYFRELVAYWRDGYEWRKAEAAINALRAVSGKRCRCPGAFHVQARPWPRPIPLILTQAGRGLSGTGRR